jgi:Domain of unknown function (DUF397)
VSKVANTNTIDTRTRLTWRKSRRSNGGGGSGGGNGCVDIAWLNAAGDRAVRDHKLQDASPVFGMSAGNWAALRAAALHGALNIN